MKFYKMDVITVLQIYGNIRGHFENSVFIILAYNLKLKSN